MTQRQRSTVFFDQISRPLSNQWRWLRAVPTPVLPHVILLPDASPAMLPAWLDLVGLSVPLNRKTKPSLTPKAAEAGLEIAVVITLSPRRRRLEYGPAFC